MKDSLNFKNIFLSSMDLKILTDAKNGSVIEVHPADAQFLLDYGFISRYALSNDECKFVITPLGSQYIEYLDGILTEKDKEEERLIREENRLRRAEIRSWLALLISALALFGKPILNLLKSL